MQADPESCLSLAGFVFLPSLDDPLDRILCLSALRLMSCLPKRLAEHPTNRDLVSFAAHPWGTLIVVTVCLKAVVQLDLELLPTLTPPPRDSEYRHALPH